MNKFGIKNDYAVVDLFCGVGGLTRGFLDQGFQVSAGIDFDASCRYAFETNNKSKFLHKDIGKITSKEVEECFPEDKEKILIGCAPCQPFSILNRRQGSSSNINNRDRWKLLYSFASIIKNLRPTVVSMENVPLLKGFQGGVIFNDFVSALEDVGYHISYEIHNAKDYGVPQRRQRLVLLGSLMGKIEMISPTHKHNPVTVGDAIGWLAPIEAGEVSIDDPLHRARNLTELSMRRIKATPEGGGWKDWDDSLIADCHKKKGGSAFGSAYGRMSMDDVAPTMTTYCTGYNNGRFGHPSQDRPISIREAALLQSFPKDYDFIDPETPFSIGRLSRHIGNAVPVALSQAIAKSVELHIESSGDGQKG